MRYIVGIDLGTTNCAVSFVDTEQPSLPIQLFAVPQLTTPGKVDALHALPSFCYLCAPGEWSEGALQLPWKSNKNIFVGHLAKTEGAKVPTRLVQSAKSWLCNVAANRRDKILPIEAADISQRLSPVEASVAYLSHIREAWNATIAKGKPELALEEQEIILTVPASFDEVARSLTIEAARQSEFLHVTLIEEPQAAFYSWISKHEQEWRQLFKAGDSILVCDVGGGTTDFSLIEIQQQEGELSFQRMAVGDHLLLGGDNIDAALAYYLEKKIEKENHVALDASQWLQLLAQARNAKEELLGNAKENASHCSIVIQGVGSAVVGGSIASTVQRTEVEQLLMEGFFGHYPLEEALRLKKNSGFRSMGLPYEDEPSITKHLAYFLQQSNYFKEGKKVDYILFNGGTLKPESFQLAIERNLSLWFPHSSVKRLSSFSLDLAVARGAAYYGKVRRGFGVAIGGGLPRSYYLKVDVKDASGVLSSKGLTLLPRGTKEGYLYQPERQFSLRPNMPVAFHLLTSHVRLHDEAGDLVEIDPNEMQPLPPIQTILRFGKKQGKGEESEPLLPVRLGIRLTEVGTVELWLDSQKSAHKWNLEFQLRSVSGQEPARSNPSTFSHDETFEKGYLDEAERSIEELFTPGSPLKPSQIMERLEEQIKLPRKEWKPSILRKLGDLLLKAAPRRKLSAPHESRWWNLAGFFLRPGYGYPLDDFRMKELWKIILADMKSSTVSEIFIQICICIRRVSGGFNKGQQMQLANEWISLLIEKKSGKIEIKRKSDLYFYTEKMSAFASLERIELALKIKVGDALLYRILHDGAAKSDYWALGRLGARQLLYGSAGQVVQREVCARWIEKLLKLKVTDELRKPYLFLLEQLGRKSDHRELNVSEELVNKILSCYPDDDLKKALLEAHQLTIREQEEIFGDHIPAGLIIEE